MGGQLLVQLQRSLDQTDHLVMPRLDSAQKYGKCPAFFVENPDFVLGQTIHLIHQLVDLPIGDGELLVEELTGAGALLLRGAGLLLLQLNHPRHQFDHLVMPRLDIAP